MRLIDYQRYFQDRFILNIIDTDIEDNKRIVSGILTYRDSSRPPVPIVNGVPRFVPENNYADNFGLQWNTFRSTQLDSVNGLRLSFNRFWAATRWKPKDLFGKTVLEIGSGAGRFTEVLLDAGATVVSVDYSNAVDANFNNNSSKGDVCILQGDLYDLPFNDNVFDFVFCFGVLQHTPDPDRAYQSIFAKLKPGGHISIDYYLKYKYPNVWATPKYLWRPVTTKMEPARLLRIIQVYIPFWFPIDTFIRRIPKFGPILLSIVPIPCWNPVGSGLSYTQRKVWAIMDTFDALGAKFDQPRTLDEVRLMVEHPLNAELQVFYGSNGVVANVTKAQV